MSASVSILNHSHFVQTVQTGRLLRDWRRLRAWFADDGPTLFWHSSVGVQRVNLGNCAMLPETLAGEVAEGAAGGGLLILPARFALTDFDVFCLR